MILPENEKDAYKQEFKSFATQFASAISQFGIDDGQWVGRLLRVYCELDVNGVLYGGGEDENLPQDMKDTVAAEKTRQLLQFLRNQGIADIAISDVTYDTFTDDQNPNLDKRKILYYVVRGFIDINRSSGGALVTGKRYSFEHRIKKTYHATKIVIREVGPIPEPVAEIKDEQEVDLISNLETNI